MNRARAFVLACAAIVAAGSANVGAAVAGDSGGISGYVVDAASGRAVPGERLLYYRWPYVENATVVGELQTDARGFFSDITLAPGRYFVAVPGTTQIAGCAIDDVFGGEVSRVRIVLGRANATCSGPRPNPSLVDANATTDVYRI